MIVLPDASTTVAPRGTLTEPDGPIALIRFFSTTTVPLGITSSPFMVINRAFVNAIVPEGFGRGTVIAISPIFCGLASVSFCRYNVLLNDQAMVFESSQVA